MNGAKRAAASRAPATRPHRPLARERLWVALLLDTRDVRELSVGGMLLGPDPGASYKLGFVHVDRGASLLAYSDGVIEREDAGGHIFGRERLGDWLSAAAQTPAEDAVADLLARLAEYGGGRPFEDDVTVMLVRRT